MADTKLKRRRPEFLVASLCVICAVIASSFAAYMIPRSDQAPGLTPSEGFMIFARPSTTHREPFMKFDERPTAVAEAPAFDPMPIGSIRPLPEQKESNELREKPVAAELPGYALRGAFDGKILVQGPNGFELVGPGDQLHDVGPILSIRYDKGRWIVLTQAGSISSNSQN